jgi:hypothetical protein
MAFDSTENIKFYIKSSPKTFKLVNISRESKKGAKNSYDSYPTEFVFGVKNGKKTPARPIHLVIQKEKTLTWKHLSKIGWTKFSFGLPWNRGRRQKIFVKMFFFGNHEIGTLLSWYLLDKTGRMHLK